jgi:hypothetical protein
MPGSRSQPRAGKAAGFKIQYLRFVNMSLRGLYAVPVREHLPRTDAVKWGPTWSGRKVSDPYRKQHGLISALRKRENEEDHNCR